MFFIQITKPSLGAVQINRLVITQSPQTKDHALTFSQRIDAYQVAAFRKQSE